MPRAALIAPMLALSLAAGAAGAAHACIRPIDGPGEWMANRYSTVAVATIVEVVSRAADRPNRSWTAVAERLDARFGGDPSADMRDLEPPRR